MSGGDSLVQADARAPVHVSAGGTLYTTTLATLTRFPDSKLAMYFNGSLPFPPLDPINQHYFLDIDGPVFRHTLNFLRCGELVLPENFDQLHLLLKQAQELDIKPLCEELENLKSEIGEDKEDLQSKKKTKRQRRKKRKLEMRKGIYYLLKRLGEGFQQLIEKLEQKIEKIDVGEKNQEEGERVDPTAKLEDGMHRLIVNLENKMETVLNENEDKRQKEEEQRDKLMKSLEDGFQRMFESENTMDRMIRMQEKLQGSVKSSGLTARVIFVHCFYQNFNTKENPCYKTSIISHPDKLLPDLDKPVEVTNMHLDLHAAVYTYPNLGYRGLIMANIASQLVDLGYQLIVGGVQIPTFREYVFVRS